MSRCACGFDLEPFACGFVLLGQVLLFPVWGFARGCPLYELLGTWLLVRLSLQGCISASLLVAVPGTLVYTRCLLEAPMSAHISGIGQKKSITEYCFVLPSMTLYYRVLFCTTECYFVLQNSIILYYRVFFALPSIILYYRVFFCMTEWSFSQTIPA